MRAINRQWLLERRPTGTAAPKDFRYREVPVDLPPLEPGQVAIENVLFGLAPTIRNWMDPPSNSLCPSVPLGEPILV
jgi:NADPH-dependent curcumin reductase CurA